MCGICGIYNFKNNNPINADLLLQMCEVLKHRGPDDQGIWSRNKIGLGHRRLSIIDLSSQGHQPMSNENGAIWIVFNGEIYNFLEIRENLIKRGHKFKSNTDTEVIIHLYEEKGNNCVNDLRGMFAFAIWDEKNKKMLLARDRIGKKPLYYMVDNRRLIFASEIKSILQDETVKKEIDFEALDDFLTFQCILAPKTIFKGIKKLLPGHILVCTPEKIETKEYWDLSFSKLNNKKEEYYIERLSELLNDAVKCRLISDVPLGAFLSGGIDSSSIVALMSEILGRSVITSSIGFKEQKFNELEFSRSVANQFNTKHYEHIVNPNALEVLRKLIWHFDEPFADSSAIPTYYVSKMTREHVTVALSGDGGDEVFAGYRRYYYDRLENQLRIVPEFLRKYLIGSLAKVYPKADRLPQFLRGKTFLTNLSLSPERGYMNTRSTFKYEMKDRLYSEDIKKRLGDYDSFSILDYYFKKADTDDSLSRIQYVDIKTYLADDILTKVDRMSMANSLEVRCPLLDHKLLEFAATIPSDLKLKGKISKYIFKKCMKEKISKEVFTRKKWGFVVPIGYWFRNNIKEMVEEILFDSKTQMGEYFNPTYIRRMWNDHLSGKRDYSANLWCLLIFELWHRNYIDGL